MKKQLPYFLIAFVLPVTAMLWWWGLFSSTTVEVAQRGGYRYVYIEAQGVYSKLAGTQKEVRFQLERQGIKPGAEFTLMLSDPRNTPSDQLKARTGYLIDAQAKPAKPLLVGEVPLRQVAVAEIKAHPLLAYGKTYAALLDYAKQHDTTLHLPTVEIFEHSVLRVEMPLQADNVAQVKP